MFSFSNESTSIIISLEFWNFLSWTTFYMFIFNLKTANTLNTLPYQLIIQSLTPITHLSILRKLEIINSLLLWKRKVMTKTKSMKLGYRLYIYMGYYFWTFIEQHVYLSSKKELYPEKMIQNVGRKKRGNINTWISWVHLQRL